ncbi:MULTISPECIES: hypothetical protein [Trichocoleus]|uniref:Uncharacterized protein n=1 Tax=Trichocoleus desertorum GB2-A4 TaxID=2933944 RepID=A0ABV0JFS1_9CYAN|nr:hypothetical protein [Trichocoleus sp. FACHB-46]MBD1865682.1 hypothetical protein [Trichocoleus sp. FACHB-46]
METHMLFEIKTRPSIITSILPEAVPLPKFSLFSVLEIDGTAMQIIGLNYYYPIAAEQLSLERGWAYQVSNGSPSVSVLSEQELLDCSPINQVEVVAIAA